MSPNKEQRAERCCSHRDALAEDKRILILAGEERLLAGIRCDLFTSNLYSKELLSYMRARAPEEPSTHTWLGDPPW